MLFTVKSHIFGETLGYKKFMVLLNEQANWRCIFIQIARFKSLIGNVKKWKQIFSLNSICNLSFKNLSHNFHNKRILLWTTLIVHSIVLKSNLNHLDYERIHVTLWLSFLVQPFNIYQFKLLRKYENKSDKISNL